MAKNDKPEEIIKEDSASAASAAATADTKPAAVATEDAAKDVPQDVPIGCARLKGGNCSVLGVSYIAEKGIVTVPHEAAAILMKEQGYTPE